MSAIIYRGGVIRQWWDDVSRTYSEFDPRGELLPHFPREYSPTEHANADREAADLTIQANTEQLHARIAQVQAANAVAIAKLEAFATGTVALTSVQRDEALRDLAGQTARALRQLNALGKLEIQDLTNLDNT